MLPFRNKLPHLILHGHAKPEPYTSPNQFPRPKYPERNRLEHANHLLSQLQSIHNQKLNGREATPKGAASPDGIYLEFESTPGFAIDFQKLDLPSKQIELLNVKNLLEDKQEKTIATVFIPDSKINLFIKKIEDYRDRETIKGNPKNNALIRGINNIKVGALKSLWTDTTPFPEISEFIWWEVWLRATPESLAQFQDFSQRRKIQLSARSQEFPDRHIILAYSSAEILSEIFDSLSVIAEIRKAKETTNDFLQMHCEEQKQWTDTFLSLVDHPSNNESTVCILDSGVTNKHPLINPFLPSDKSYSCLPDGDTMDLHGHGTNMAGLVLYGDLSLALLSTQRVQVPCQIESVKIFAPHESNEPDLYGNITEEAVSRATIGDPSKYRIICMAVSSSDNRDKGQPSSWSASIDRICAGLTATERHLVIVAAGNVQPENYINYPSANYTDGIHDPGQSWNALTVGAFTEKTQISETHFSKWTPLAPAGNIAPANTTSLIWENNKWPIKPDIVFEGGNSAIDPTRKSIDHPESLALLSTHHSPTTKLFTYMADTSAAAAQIAHMAATIINKYPNIWPETLRGLIVHSAEWTETTKKSFPINTKQERAALLRTCGYGVPSLERALWSASNSLTLLVEDELRPYNLKSMHELNLYNLPWPTDILQSLGETPVKMRITLSYFIEPNPARRGWEHKFRYQSHGLRFDVKTPTETGQEFITRINKKYWDEELGRPSSTSRGDASDWFFGERIRSKGSIHSDIWEGTAASLAERNQIAIFPVTGWWREKQLQDHMNKKARYSLIITLGTPELTADIYTPIETTIMSKINI